MGSTYYETIDRMEKEGVDPEYIIGWASGFLRSPEREVQNLNEAYKVGYVHGTEKNASGFGSWVRK